jgi:hypothetical protein
VKKNETDRVGRDDDPAGENRTSSRRGPSALLLLAGLATMVVAVAALIGQGAIAALGDVQFRWVFVVVAVVVGFALLLGPSKKS